jgi:biotin carboxylase
LKGESKKVPVRNSSKKHLLILGASSDQLPIYHAAQKMGCYIIGVDRNERACARPLADEFLHLGIADPDDLLSALKDKQIDGVISPGSDTAHEAIYALSHKFDLPNKPSLAAVKSSLNKPIFLEHINALKLYCPPYYHSQDFDQLKSGAAEIGYPLIVKPVDSSGSKGFTYVESPDELDAALRKALDFSCAGEVIIEQYVHGPQYGAEVFRLQGKTILLAITKRTHTSKPNFLTLRHFISPSLPEGIQSAISTTIDSICDQLEIKNGPVNIDFIINDEQQIYFHDMGARLGGNGLPDLVKLSYGLDTYELALMLTIGENTNEYCWPRKKIRYAGLRLITSKHTGSFVAIEGLDGIKNHPAFIETQLFVTPGDPVFAFSQVNHKLGYVLAAHENAQYVKDVFDFMDTHFTIRVNVNS